MGASQIFAWPLQRLIQELPKCSFPGIEPLRFPGYIVSRGNFRNPHKHLQGTACLA